MRSHKPGCAAVDDHHVTDGITFRPCDCGADKPATWRDLEERSLSCVVLHRMMGEVARGMPREQAMIETLLFLSETRETALKERVEALMLENPDGRAWATYRDGVGWVAKDGFEVVAQGKDGRVIVRRK